MVRNIRPMHFFQEKTGGAHPYCAVLKEKAVQPSTKQQNNISPMRSPEKKIKCITEIVTHLFHPRARSIWFP